MPRPPVLPGKKQELLRSYMNTWRKTDGDFFPVMRLLIPQVKLTLWQLFSSVAHFALFLSTTANVAHTISKKPR
jgi:hypothetical protein